MTTTMRIAIISENFAPLRTSGAVQLRDLSQELVRLGHKPTVMVPSPEIDRPWLLEDTNGLQVLRLKAPRTKDTNYVQRTLAELTMPFFMLYNLRKSPLAKTLWDGVVWYSPSIFLGPISSSLKKTSGCRSYLIVRDLFPEWAVDMGLLRRGLAYRFFKTIERYQYSVADVIGVQTPSNLPYFDCWAKPNGQRIEVLQNWLAETPVSGCCITVAATHLAGRMIFIYAGNMGVSQGMDIVLSLAESLRERSDIGFLFVGRGSDSQRLREDAQFRGLNNVLFHDEIDPMDVPGLLRQCHIGLVALDPRHKTHNIPGKFLSYMQSGLPVLASINPGNDLAELIQSEGVGRVCTDYSVATLHRMAEELTNEISSGISVSARCRALSKKLFSSETAANQIVAALEYV